MDISYASTKNIIKTGIPQKTANSSMLDVYNDYLKYINAERE